MNSFVIKRFSEEIRYHKPAVTRGHGIIRARCQTFIKHLKQEKYVWLPVDEAKDKFSFLINCWDRTTLKAYFGTQKSQAERVIDRTAHYTTGTVSHKKIRLRQKIPERKGYLEKLGLVTYEWNPDKGCYYLVVDYDNPLCPEIGQSSTSVNEVCVGSIANFSLTPTAPTVTANSLVLAGVETLEPEKERECYRVREKSQMTESDESNPVAQP